MTLKSESAEWAFFLSFPAWWKQCCIRASWAQVTGAGAGAGQLLLAILCPPPRMAQGPHATLIQASLDSSFTFLWFMPAIEINYVLFFFFFLGEQNQVYAPFPDISSLLGCRPTSSKEGVCIPLFP